MILSVHINEKRIFGHIAVTMSLATLLAFSSIGAWAKGGLLLLLLAVQYELYRMLVKVGRSEQRDAGE